MGRWRGYLDAFYRRGAPPQGHSPPRSPRQRSWWWQGREPPDRHPRVVPSHGVCTHLRPRHHRHPRRTTPRRAQGYVYVPLLVRSSFFLRRAPRSPDAVIAGFFEQSCKQFHPLSLPKLFFISLIHLISALIFENMLNILGGNINTMLKDSGNLIFIFPRFDALWVLHYRNFYFFLRVLREIDPKV